MGKTPSWPRSQGKVPWQLSPKVHPTAAEERKVLGPVFCSRPHTGLGLPEFKASGALGDQAK